MSYHKNKLHKARNYIFKVQQIITTGFLVKNPEGWDDAPPLPPTPTLTPSLPSSLALREKKKET